MDSGVGSEACVFCRIVQGSEVAAIVLEDQGSTAFLDYRPVFPGHCLLVPKEHVETLSDLALPLVGPLFANARLLARAVEVGLQSEGSLVAINNRVSQSVPPPAHPRGSQAARRRAARVPLASAELRRC